MFAILSGLPFLRGALSVGMIFLCIEGCTSGKESTCHAEDTRDADSISRSGRSPSVGNGDPSSILAWIIPWTDEPQGDGPQGSQSVGHQ